MRHESHKHTSDIDKEEARTFLGWVDKGRGVKKGERASYYEETIIDGKTVRQAMFLKSQTIKLVRIYRDLEAEVRQYWKRDGYFGSDASGYGTYDPRKFGKNIQY